MMMQIKPLREAFSQVGKIFRSQWKLWLPFLLTAFLELLFIGLIWLAPHEPFSKVLAPPIRYFFSDRVLHYPAHLWFLYHAMQHTHFVVSTLIGAFMTGIACVMVYQTRAGMRLSLRDALVSGQVGYGTMLILWLIMWGLAKGMLEAIARLAPGVVWVAWAGIGLTVALQALLVYAIPIAVFEQLSWWRAVGRSARETLRFPISTLIVVLLPSAVSILFAITCSSPRVAQWMVRTLPEIVVLPIIARLLIWTLTDAVMTITIAHLWWAHRVDPDALHSAGVPLVSGAPHKDLKKKGHAVAST